MMPRSSVTVESKSRRGSPSFQRRGEVTGQSRNDDVHGTDETTFQSLDTSKLLVTRGRLLGRLEGGMARGVGEAKVELRLGTDNTAQNMKTTVPTAYLTWKPSKRNCSYRCTGILNLHDKVSRRVTGDSYNSKHHSIVKGFQI